MGDAARELEELVAGELSLAPSEAAVRLSEEIHRRHGEALLAVVFYGSCLRRETAEGVLDFYAVVESYAAAYASRPLRWANAVLPPNVFYLEVDGPGGRLRSKYAVLSLADFERGAGPDTIRTGVWARFAQPARIAWARDEAARTAVVRAAARSVRTLVERIAPLLPERFELGELWQRALRETYAAEMRTEAPETIASLYRSDPGRYQRAARLALRVQAESGGPAVEEGPDGRIELRLDPSARAAARRAWSGRRPVAKLVSLLALAKSTFTFGDWLPYVLWKLERHTGTRIEPTERQRRHPLIWGWPILLKVLWRKDFR